MKYSADPVENELANPFKEGKKLAMMSGNCKTALAKMIGMTPEVLTFTGM